jgi:hypothetical protein
MDGLRFLEQTVRPLQRQYGASLEKLDLRNVDLADLEENREKASEIDSLLHKLERELAGMDQRELALRREGRHRLADKTIDRRAGLRRTIRALKGERKAVPIQQRQVVPAEAYALLREAEKVKAELRVVFERELPELEREESYFAESANRMLSACQDYAKGSPEISEELNRVVAATQSRVGEDRFRALDAAIADHMFDRTYPGRRHSYMGISKPDTRALYEYVTESAAAK